MLPPLYQPPLFQGVAFQGVAPWTPRSVAAPNDAVQWLGCLDEGYLLDKIGTGTERILNGGPGLQRGHCYDFDGTDDEVTVADAADLRPGTGDLSFSCWVNPDVTSTALVLAGKTNGQTAATSLGWWLGQTASNEFEFTVSKSGGSSVATSSTTFAAGTWYHVVGVLDSGTAKIYVDASLEDTGASSSFDLNGTDDLYFGSENSNSHFNGQMFGALLYDDVLTADEVTYLHALGVSGDNPTLASSVGQWLMDEQSGTAAYDSSGNSNDGTLVGGVSHSTQDVNSWQNKFGYRGSVCFDGVDDYATLDGVADSVFDGDFTIKFTICNHTVNGYILHKFQGSLSVNYGASVANSLHVGNSSGGVRYTVDAAGDWVIQHDTSESGFDRWKVYKDGVLLVRDSTVGSYVQPTNNSTVPEIGRRSSGAPYWGGCISGLAFWTALKTAAEAAANDQTGLANHWLLNEGSGTSILDTSSNSAHGTLAGAAWHFIPKDYGAAGEVDINGAALDYSGRAPFHARAEDSFCGHFDGTDDYVAIGNTGTAVKSISFRVHPDSVTSHTDWVIDLNGTDYVTIVNGTVTVNGFAAATTTIYVDGAVSSTVTAAAHTVTIVSDTAFTASDLELGRLSGTGYLDGRLFDVRLYTDELTAAEALSLADQGGTAPTNDADHWYRFGEGAGTTIYDSSTNADHGTATNITAGTFWSATNDIFPGNLLYGFRLASGVRIPARVGGSVAAEGSAITNPAGCWHNDAESKINFNPYTIPELMTYQLGFDAPTAFDVRASEFTEQDQQWVYRESEIKIKDYTIFRNALTLTDRDYAWGFFQTVVTLNAEVLAAWKYGDADWYDYYTAADVVGSHDATDSSAASDNWNSGVDGVGLEMYDTCSMDVSPTLGNAITAFTVSGWMRISDLGDDFQILGWDAGTIQVGYTSSGQDFYFTYNGTTISSTTTLSTDTWYHIVAGINEHGDMTLFVDGVLVDSGSATMLGSTVGSWVAGYCSTTMQEEIDEVCFFVGKRLTANAASKLKSPTYISNAGAFS